MANRWDQRHLCDVADVIISNVDKKTTEGETPVRLCNYTDVYQNQFIRRGMEFMSATAKEREIAKCALSKGDVVITKDSEESDDIGVPAYIRDDIEGLVCGYHLVLLRPRPAVVDGAFLFYALSARDAQIQFHAKANGITRFGLRKNDIESIDIPTPPLPVQCRIGAILGSLEDKIDLNRRMNRTLEKTAAALFKSWFIDFDPVHAKADGRDTGLPAEIADIFPDSFDDSDLGLIPKGWKVRPIGDVVRCVGGATPSTKNSEFWEGGRHPFVTPKDMSSLQGPVILDSERCITDAGVEKISSRQLPVGTVILSSRAPIGYLGVAAVPVSVNQGVIAMICDGDLPNLYILQWTATNMDLIKSRAGGTTFAEISKQSFRPIPALIPDKPVLDAFMSNVTPLYGRVTLNIRQNRRLAVLRDALLSKLMDGEIELPDTAAVAKEVL